MTPTSHTGSWEQGCDGVLDAQVVMPLLAPWDSFALVQWMHNWGASSGKNSGPSPFLRKPKAWGKADIESWPRGTARGGGVMEGSSALAQGKPRME